MKVSVFGLGYVGCVLTACLSRHGHDVTGVDVNPQKVRQVEAGRSPVEEAGVEELLEDGVAEGRITATTDPATAVAESSVSFVTVGTPLDETGQLDATNVYNVLDSMLGPLDGTAEHSVVVRSTVPPGTTRNLRTYLEERLPEGTDVSLTVNPEFLREGCALDDFYDPPYVILGTFPDDDASAVRELYGSFGLTDRVETVAPAVAESLKMTNNAFHALKVSFANEVGSIASAAGVDGKELLSLVCRDTKLNISSQYMEPGFAFGGSCLPKDTRAIATVGARGGVETPLIESILDSNDAHIDRVARRVDSLDGDTVGVVGVPFKSGTADVRNSPGLRLARQLEGEVVLFAGGIDLSAAMGSNRDYLDRAFPDLEERLVDDVGEFLGRADAVVFTNDDDHDAIASRIEDHPVCDPVGAVREWADSFSEYHTVSW